MSPGTPRSWLRSRGPTNRTSTPSNAAIRSTCATAFADSICTTVRTSVSAASRPPGPDRSGRHGCTWPRHGLPPADSAGAAAPDADFVGGLQPGQHDAGAPRSRIRPSRIRAADSARTTVGTPYAAAARTTVPTCSSPPAPCSRSRSAQSIPAAGADLGSHRRCGAHEDTHGGVASGKPPAQPAVVERNVTVVRLSVVLDVIRTVPLCRPVPFRTRSATARRCPRRTPRRVRRPTTPGGWQVGMRDGGNHDDDRSVVIAGAGRRVTHFGGSSGAQRVRQAACDLRGRPGGTHRRGAPASTSLTVGEAQAAVAVAELVAELPAAAQHLQPMDHLVAVVLGDDDGDRRPFLRGGDQLGGRHQERAVPDKRHHALGSVRERQSAAQSGWNLVAHAGEAELQVAVAAVGGVPDLLQVSGWPTGGGDDRVTVPGLLQQTDDLALGQHRVCAGHHVGVGGDRRLVERLIRVQRGFAVPPAIDRCAHAPVVPRRPGW